MIRHATSHGFSVLVCTIVSAFLIDILRPELPRLMNYIENVSKFVVPLFSLPFTVHEFNIVLVASILALIWGVLFKLQKKD